MSIIFHWNIPASQEELLTFPINRTKTISGSWPNKLAVLILYTPYELSSNKELRREKYVLEWKNLKNCEIPEKYMQLIEILYEGKCWEKSKVWIKQMMTANKQNMQDKLNNCFRMQTK